MNVDPDEGTLTPLDLEEFLGAVGSTSVAADDVGAPDDDAVPGEDLERAQGVWRYLLMGTFLLLLGETVVSNGLSRHALRRTEEGREDA